MSEQLFVELAEMRRELSRLQGRVTTLVNLLNALQLPQALEHRCPACGVRQRGPLSLAEHVYVAHAGPVPPAWLAAEERANGNSDGH